VTNFVTLTPQGPDKFALILYQEAKRLRLMDRYEQRALLRRTIRAFDAARNGVVGIWSYRSMKVWQNEAKLSNLFKCCG
jgi:hypothetical protein